MICSKLATSESPMLILYTKSLLRTHDISYATRGKTPDLVDDYARSDYDELDHDKWASDWEGWLSDRNGKRRMKDRTLKRLKYLDDVKNTVMARMLRTPEDDMTWSEAENYTKVVRIVKKEPRRPEWASSKYKHYSELYFHAGSTTPADMMRHGSRTLEDYCLRIMIHRLGQCQMGPLQEPDLQFLCFATACHIERQAGHLRPDMRFGHCYRVYMNSQKRDVDWLIENAEYEVRSATRGQVPVPLCTNHRGLSVERWDPLLQFCPKCRVVADEFERERDTTKTGDSVKNVPLTTADRVLLNSMREYMESMQTSRPQASLPIVKKRKIKHKRDIPVMSIEWDSE